MKMIRITPPIISTENYPKNRIRSTKAASKCLIAAAVLIALPALTQAEDAVGNSHTFQSVDQITGTVYGGKATAGGKAEGNSITISIDDASKAVGSAVYAGYATGGNVIGNTLTVTEGANVKFNSRSLYAGYLKSTQSATGLALTDNKIVVEDRAKVDLGSGSSLYAAHADLEYTSYKEPKSMTGNAVEIGVGASVTGGVVAARGLAQSFSGNSVVVKGTVSRDVYGVDTVFPNQSQVDVSYDDISVTLENASVGGSVLAVKTAKANNTASITNLYVSVTNSDIVGQIGTYSSKSTSVGTLAFTGVNTVGNVVSSFETMILNVSDVNESEAVLTGTKVGYNFDLSDKTLLINGLDTAVAEGNYKLVEFDEGGSIGFNSNTKIVKEGVFVDRLWKIDGDVENGSWGDGLQIVQGDLMSGDLLISAGAEKANDNSKTLAESFLGSIAFLNQGAEFIADEGLRAMTEAATTGKFTAFGAIHGGTSRYETGSHVDVDGVTLATGVATKFDNLTLAGFIEAGWASSEGHVAGTKGDGDHDYYGVGAALRYNFESPFYLDGSARFGAASTEFDGRYADSNAKYEADGLYGSMHIGAGYLMRLTDDLGLDLYGRYVLTYLEGDTTDLGTADGEKLDMDDTLTHAFRVGARITGDFNETASWHVGLAYEHVADGDAESDVIASGTRATLDVPSLEGDIGVVEVGFKVRPNGSSPWSANIGVKGYVGDRQGVSGNASILFTF